MGLVKKKPLTKIKEDPKLIIVTSLKGGVGKSTVSSAMASVIAHTYNHKICGIDGDETGSLTKNLGGDLSLPGTAHLLCKSLGDEAQLQEFDDYLAVYSGNEYLLDRKFRPSFSAFSNHVKELMNAGISVLIDTSNKEHNLLFNFLDLATDILVVFNPDADAFAKGEEIMDHIEASYTNGVGPKTHLVLTDYRAGKTQHMSVLYSKKIPARWPDTPFFILKHSPAFPKCREFKCPITKWDHKKGEPRLDADFIAKGPYITDIQSIVSFIYNEG